MRARVEVRIAGSPYISTLQEPMKMAVEICVGDQPICITKQVEINAPPYLTNLQTFIAAVGRQLLVAVEETNALQEQAALDEANRELSNAMADSRE